VVLDYLDGNGDLIGDEPVVMEHSTYQSKLADRINHHTKLDYDPASGHEKIPKCNIEEDEVKENQNHETN
jgi:hypothetical protein